MNYTTILICQGLSAESKITFPEVVKQLREAGVISYDIDLVEKRVTYYDEYDQSLHVGFGLNELPPVNERFDAEAVAQAVKRNQRGESDYPSFISEIMNAGVSLYTAYLTGRRVVYTGLSGQSHTEYFPPATEKP